MKKPTKLIKYLFSGVCVLLVSCNGGQTNSTGSTSTSSNKQENVSSKTTHQVSNTEAQEIHEFLYVTDYHDNCVNMYEVKGTKEALSLSAATRFSTIKGVVGLLTEPGALFTSHNHDDDNHKVKKCLLDQSNGYLTSCDGGQKTGNDNRPYKMVMAHVEGQHVLYANGLSGYKLHLMSYNNDYNASIYEQAADFSDSPSDLAITPDNKHIFAAYQSSSINNLVSIVPSLPTKSPNKLIISNTPKFVAIATTNYNLYAISGAKLYNYSITPDSTYGIDANPSPIITDIGSSDIVGSGNHIVVTPNERFIYISDAFNHMIHVFQNSGTNVLTRVFDYYTAKNDGIKNPDIMTVNKSGTLLYVENGSTSTDIRSWDLVQQKQIDIFYINQEDGSLTLVNKLREGDGSITSMSTQPDRSCATINDGKGCIIFITSNDYRGDLEQLPGANERCMDEAINDPNLSDLVNQGVKFKALIAQNTSTVKGRTYYRKDRITKIATADGTNLAVNLDNPIENADANKEFWSALSTGDAERTSADDNCNNWTHTWNDEEDKYHKGFRSYTSRPGAGWTDQNARANCDEVAYLACVAQ